MRVLIIEDEEALRNQIVEKLQSEGFAIDASGDGEEGLYLAREMPVNLAVIDLGLPGLDGMEIIRKIREEGHLYPILILTARDRWQDRVEGLEAGADDYLTKDISLEHLAARVVALFRRIDAFQQPQQPEDIIHAGELSLDLHRMGTTWKNEPVPLTVTELWMVHALVKHPGHVKTRQQCTVIFTQTLYNVSFVLRYDANKRLQEQQQ